MKKISLAVIAFSLMNVSASAIDLSEFTGDTKLSCEAILCLASPYKPSECSPALARYFGFSAKYWSDVVKMRTNFLNLCPLGANNNVIKSDDKELEAWRNSLVNLTGTCYIPDLNKKQQRTILWVEEIKRCTHGDGCTTVKINHYGFRIDPNLDNNCKILSSNKYSNYNLKYTCPTKFYPEEDWNNGYEKKEVSQSEFNSLKEEDRFTADKLTKISYSEYKNLPNNKRKISTSGFKTTYYRIDLGYYKKEWINKNCWINQGK